MSQQLARIHAKENEGIIESGEADIKSQLQALDRVQYDRQREQLAEQYGIRKDTLDKLFKESAKETSEGGKLEIEEVEPCDGPVDGAALLDDIERQFRRFVVADREVLEAATLWAAFSWFHDDAEVSPPAHISAPEKRCGKSVLLTCFANLVCRPLPTSNITGAALFRAIDKWQPCLLVDEVDSFMGDAEDLRGIINSGFERPNAFVVRCVGDDFEPTMFNTFAPKVLCGIGNLPGTVMDRAIPLQMRRKKTDERVERLRHSSKAEWLNIRQRLARWSLEHAQAMHATRPNEIAGLNDRAQDAWEPLQQVAALAGGDWPDKARRAAIALHGIEEDTPSIGAELLADIKQVFEDRQANKIFSADLLEDLLEDEESPWATWNRGKPMTRRQLSKKLEPFGIKSKQIRIGAGTGKMGYCKEQFADAWNRYLVPEPPAKTSTSLQSPHNNGYSAFKASTEETPVEEEKAVDPLQDKGCRSVEDSEAQDGSSEYRRREVI